MATRKIDTQLLAHLWRISTSSTRDVDAVLQDLMECSLPQFLILRTLASLPSNMGALAATDIARALGCSKANAGQLVTKLAARGRLKKLPRGEDGRVVTLRLTASGERDYERGEEQIAEDGKRIFERLSAAEKEQLLALLRKIE